jgi:N utilization substance protein B
MSANPSLQKKTAARCAAVQGLYELSITGEQAAPADQAARLKQRLEGNAEEQKLLVGMVIEPNYKMVETLLAGVSEHEGDINSMIDASLAAGWMRSRMSPLLVALLQCAVFELEFGKDLSPRIVIDEYTRLARRFFADTEVNFVHGILSALAQTPHA